VALGVALLLGWPALAAPQEKARCADCHDDVVQKMSNQTHMRIQPFEVNGRTVGCEGCHGDGTRHIESGDKTAIHTFSKEADDSDACLTCHRGKGMPEWHASTHAQQDVACTKCHTIHRQTSPQDSCRGCHGRETSQFQLPSHHPLREGKMTCASCHDVHSANEAQLKTGERLNELCYGCHQEVEGPYMFEHAPVQEDCRQCHAPHGTIANKLLIANEPMLCLQCHEMHFHTGVSTSIGDTVVGGISYPSTNGPRGMDKAFNTKCTQCHIQIHGSDLPSQSVSAKGRGLVR
jgi:DmsE family decaheme c-type cytochrome